MPITCPVCQAPAPEGARFCEGCGMDLTAAATQMPLPAEAPAEASVPGPAAVPAPDGGPGSSGSEPRGSAPATRSARLIIKKYGAYTGDEMPLSGACMTIGRFDPSAGPVDIDLTGMPGAEHVSRRHAEIFAEGGVWKVRDLGSTNGVFVRRSGQSGFSPRLQEPTDLHDGDELAFGNVIFLFREG